MSTSPLAIARACLQAYVDKDRFAIEALIDDDFHFTSPLDNALDRATYFERLSRGRPVSFEERKSAMKALILGTPS